MTSSPSDIDYAQVKITKETVRNAKGSRNGFIVSLWCVCVVVPLGLRFFQVFFVQLFTVSLWATAFHRILMGYLGFPWSFPWAVWFRTFNFLMVDTVLCVRYFPWPPFHSDLLALPRVPHFHSQPRAPSFRPSSLWGSRKVG